jgi:Na+-translocating ferredoxin:NAD+ oxidoreductase RnfD subunit
MRVIRWIACIPLGLIASVLLGTFASVMTEFFGGSAWYVWLVSGAASGYAFFIVTYRVAPAETNALKWIAVFILAVLGAISAIGPFLAGTDRIRSLTGFAMILMAIVGAFAPVGTGSHPPKVLADTPP